MKIMLDAGHYGLSNQSPVVPEYYESVGMWKLCEYLASELSFYGFEVLKTRDDLNKDMPVVKRGEMAKDCDLFLSLHSNAVDGEKNEPIDRVHVFGAYDNLNNSHELAKIIADAVAECMSVSGGYVSTRKSDEGEREYYGVLRGARSVGCPLFYIVEHSFHTNRKAAMWLLSDENLLRLARVEAAVIAAYFGLTLRYDIGDVDMNGRIDSADYLIVKRAVAGTLELDPIQKRLADIDTNGRIDVIDYLLLKRKSFDNN